MHDATRYDLAFRLEPLPGEEPATPISLASRAFHARSLLATIQAANQYNRTHIDAHGQATLTQRDVHGGLFGGFGWEW